MMMTDEVDFHEKHVTQHVLLDLDTNEINDVFQSAYIQHDSTETVVVKIFSYICISMGRKREGILCLLDLSSTFDI